MSRSIRVRVASAARSLGRLLVLGGAFLAAVQPASGQYDDGWQDGDRWDAGRHGDQPRWELGAGFSVLVPQGEFADFVDEGYGVGLHAVYGLDRSNVLGLRFDAGFLTYGSERFLTPLLPSTGRILVDVRTNNNIGVFSLGPQLQVPRGPLRPYVNGFVGLGYFFTESRVGGSSNFPGDDFARTTNFDDVSFAYGGGGGLALTFGKPWRPISVHFDAQYRRHGETEYLREDSILEDGFGGLLITPLLSEADFLVFQVGASIGL